jgi:hypothetical protein
MSSDEREHLSERISFLAKSTDELVIKFDTISNRAGFGKVYSDARDLADVIEHYRSQVFDDNRHRDTLVIACTHIEQAITEERSIDSAAQRIQLGLALVKWALIEMQFYLESEEPSSDIASKES